MVAFLCGNCRRLYVNDRPFICECNSNVFIEEVETTEKEIEEMKNKLKEVIYKEAN